MVKGVRFQNMANIHGKSFSRVYYGALLNEFLRYSVRYVIQYIFASTSATFLGVYMRIILSY